jgi:hypothetical protein
MNPEQENFQELRRLLGLKRYEQPPPGYFNHFSDQVIARLQAGERFQRDSLLEALLWQVPWVQRLWKALETKPIIAGAFGVTVCGLLLAGIGYSERTEPPNIAVLTPAGAVAPVLMNVASEPASPSPLNAESPAPGFSSTDGVLAVRSQDSLFQEIKSAQRPLVQTVGFPRGN